MRVLRIYPAANDPRHRRRERALRKLGVEVGLVLPERYGSDWARGPVEPELPHWRGRLWMSGSNALHAWRGGILRQAVREFKPDVVDIHEEPFWLGGYQAVVAADRVPYVMYTAQNLYEFLPPPFGRMQQRALSQTRAVYPCSSGAGEVVRRRGYRGPMPVIPIGVEEELLSLNPSGDRVGFIGRLVASKGAEHILGFGSRLLCLGDGAMRADVEAVGGEVRTVRSLEELAAGLAQMAVLVAPSLTTRTWKEQFGRMVVEAMAAGVPVVSSDSGSLPEVVGDAGIVVPEGDTAALVDGVSRALEQSDALRQAGRARVRAMYTWDVVASRCLEMYRLAAA